MAMLELLAGCPLTHSRVSTSTGSHAARTLHSSLYVWSNPTESFKFRPRGSNLQERMPLRLGFKLARDPHGDDPLETLSPRQSSTTGELFRLAILHFSVVFAQRAYSSSHKHW